MSSRAQLDAVGPMQSDKRNATWKYKQAIPI